MNRSVRSIVVAVSALATVFPAWSGGVQQARVETGSFEYSSPARAFPPVRTSLRLKAVGDIMAHDNQLESARLSDGEGYAFDAWFAAMSPALQDADLTIGNLETVLAGEDARFTGYPMFNTPDQLAGALKFAGFDILVTANNHSLDRRMEGVVRTLDVLDDNGLLHTGTRRGDSEEPRHLLIQRNRITLALLAYTYGTNGIEQWLPEGEPASLVNYIDEATMFEDMQCARRAGADFVVVYLHWGNEYQHKPTRGQVGLADALVEGGADVILGCHPHVLQPVVRKRVITWNGIEKDVLIAFSMGNFISDQRGPHKQTGAMIDLEIEKDVLLQKTYIKRVEVISTWVHNRREAGELAYTVLDLRESLAAADAEGAVVDGAPPVGAMRAALELADRVLEAPVE